MEWMNEAQAWLATHGTAFVVNLVVFLLVLLVGRIAIGAALRVARQMMERSERVSEMLANFLTSALSKGLWVIVAMIALGQLGIDIAPLIAGVAVLGLIIGFAFQESLSNLAAGIMIVLNQPFQVGDYVEAAGHSGTVSALNFMATSMTTPDNKEIVIPNRHVWGSAITNHTAHDTRRAEWTLGISYDDDIGHAIDTVRAVLREDERVFEEPAPFIEVRALADSSVDLVVRAWTSSADLWPVFFETQRTFKERFDDAGIAIPFPQLDVHHRGSAMTRG